MRSFFGVVFVAAGLGIADSGEAAGRFALVVGNGNYEGAAALANPVNDATAVAEALEKLDFEVILATDVDRRGAIAAVDAFSRAIDGAELALLFFAGHGIQIGGQNFLMPTDVSVDSERALRYSAIDIQEIVAEMERRAAVTIAILDACRDNPFLDQVMRSSGGTRSAAVSRGLGPIRLSGRGAIVAFAAAAGDVAADGTGDHSPFTAALLEEIGAPDVEVGLMFRRVGRRVSEETRGDQRPELLVRLVDEVYLNRVESSETVAVDVAASTSPSADAAEPVAETSATPSAAPAIGDRPARRAENGDRFFGARAVKPPGWFADLALPEALAWQSAPASAIDETDDNDSYGTALPVPLAVAVTARIVPRGDVDWYRVEVPTAGELSVDVDPAPAELDLHGRVWNADHRVVADWQGAAQAGGSLVARFALPRGGVYWIEMSDGNRDAESSDAFVATIDFTAAADAFEPNDSLGTAAPIPATADFTTTIFPRGDSDWYKVWVPEPGLLTVSASGVADTLDIHARIWNLNGKVVRDWVGPGRKGGDTELAAELAEPGVYAIEVSDGNRDAATVDPFSLDIDFVPVADEAEPNDSFGQALVVPPTGERAIAIFPRGDIDWLAVDVEHPGELALSATQSPENLDVFLRVWTADKEVLRDWFGPARIGGDVEDFADLPSAGRYFVEVRDGNSDQSSPDVLRLAMRFTPQPDQLEPNNDANDAAPLTPGGQVLFNILPRGDTDWFRVELAAPGELAITIDESPENLDLHYRVWNADRKIVRDWVAPYRKGGLTEGYADLPAAGVYFIEVSDGNSDARSIRHATLTTDFTPIAETFEPNNSFGTAVPIVLGETYRSNILPRGDTDWYLLEAPRPGTFVVTVDEVDEDLDVHVRLWDAEASAGQWFGPPRSGGVTEARMSVPGAGPYRLEVSDGNSDARSPNPFRLRVDFE